MSKRHWRRWRAKLRPASGRRLPAELRAGNVWRLAAALPQGLRDPGFDTLLRRIDQSPILEGNRLAAFFAGTAAFAAIHDAIAAARDEVLVESYIFKDDATGRALSESLAEAVSRGVAVRVLADAFGSIATRRSFWNEMRDRGIEVRLFNPIFPHLLLQPFRDHRKILVVDRRVAFTGGMNIGDEYGSSLSGRGGPWRDTHVRVEGPAAWDMATVFSEAWMRAGGSLELYPMAPASGGVRVLVLDSRPGRGHGETASVLSAIVGAARQRLWITNAYFAPRELAVHLLGRAAARGVDVRLLLPGKTDVRVVRHAGHGRFTSLLASGVRIYEYRDAVLHAKSVVADDFVTLVGSTNFDFRSFHFNAECNLVVLDEGVAATFTGAYEKDLAAAEEISPAAWRRRSPIHRVGDSLATLLGPAL